jgi:primosomal protein N' (replication factor Y)
LIDAFGRQLFLFHYQYQENSHACRHFYHPNILEPEIALTSQLVAEFAHHFDNILLTHSRQTEAERHRVWQEALTAEEPKVIIGPRSALFMPAKHIGLIVIDECHEPSFKQEQSPRYSALRVASVLARHHQAKVVLGSATPNVADYYLAEQSRSPIVTMQRSARADTVEPTIDLVDMTKRGNFTRHPFLSNTLLEQLETTFAESNQALIFHNRRGTASTTLCENCGWQSGCPHCYVPLTLHADQHTLRCHICDLKAPVPTSCPVCHHADIIHKGLGTKRIESELRKLFPDRTIARFDGDTASTDSVDQRYQDLYDGHIDLIIGTQVIAKGLDLPHLRTVGVVQADAGLSLPDFGAPERTFQLLAQVIGRVGRSHHATQVVVQSYQPSHPAIQDGLARNYADFYQRTLALRRHANFPPFCYLLKLVCVYKTEKSAVQNARKLASVLKQHAPSTVEILGPTPAFYERVRDTYRWQLVVKSPRRQDLIDLLQHIPSAHWQFELDPTSLL